MLSCSAIKTKESSQQLKSYSLKACRKNLWSDLTVSNDEESMQIQTLTGNFAQHTNNRTKQFLHSDSNDIEQLLESQDENLSETEGQEIIEPHSTEEASRSAEKEMLTSKTLSKDLQMAMSLVFFYKNVSFFGKNP